ncbi:bifunctional diguanylate cyclase/phosphodiesterase [Salimicrobium halophilum]|uniref:Diguanylate cyclase (GGDEF) domain-containing protein n=1 Tax=Salimicrobium halophilum TaxID=86666 RepID=A0A1G8SZT7_9BACI|nr:EAL domain-containing protein [Salimicrobium halophilum]SDJ34737.1 diguanylate cyclase (GGDEF) domain-containing protein [Salimicrobium halophilum]
MEEFIILEEFYNTKLIVASILVAILGSYLTLYMNRRIVVMKSYSRVMIVVTSVIMGMTVWAMHFIGMSAFSLKIFVSYDWILTGLSILPVLVASFLAFITLYMTAYKRWKIFVASILIGLGISGMHYLGMTAITYDGFLVYDPGMVGASIIFAIGVAYLGIIFLRKMQNVKKPVALVPVAVVLGISVSGMHYLGMAATDFCLPAQYSSSVRGTPVVSLDIFGIALVILVVTGLLFIFSYIQSRHVTLRKIAYQDALTGLNNRHWVHRFMEKEGETLHKAGKVLYMLIDIDQYQWINETFGYSQGDQLLQKFADYLSEHKESGDIVVRYEGNQFLFMTPTESNLEAKKEVRQFHESLKRPFLVGDTSIRFSTTIGAAISERKEDIPYLFGNLEQALRYGKTNGKNQFVYYDPFLHSNRREMEIDEYLKRDIEEGMKGFSLVLQPKFQLPHVSLAGAEVLVRWNHKKLGFVSPGEFIPIAEKNGTIQPITSWVLSETLRHLREWKRKGEYIPRLSINLSAVHFQAEGANEMIFETFEKMGVDPASDWVEVEVTETAVMKNIDRAMALLEEMQQRGLRIALDDFGTGLSSFMYLKKLPIHTLKLDKSFMDGVPQQEKDMILLEALIDMARKLDMEIVTEGIEDEEQHVYLNSHQVIVQGYYYARPLSLEEFEIFLQKKKDA